MGDVELVLGVGSAYFGGKTDLILQRVFDVLMAFALIIMALEAPYADAARARGFGHIRIILRHMVANVMAAFLSTVMAFVGQAILAAASLSYLGLVSRVSGPQALAIATTDAAR